MGYRTRDRETQVVYRAGSWVTPTDDKAPVVPLIEKDATLVDKGAAIHSLDLVRSLARLRNGKTNAELIGVPHGKWRSGVIDATDGVPKVI